MEENKNLEQPCEQQQTKTEIIDEQGSMYGKFNDAKSLLDAYNNLQAEFTKKCQKLSEIEREKQTEQAPVFCKDDWQTRSGRLCE